MVTTRRQSVGEASRPEEHSVQSSAERKRSRAGDEPATKRRRNDEGGNALTQTTSTKNKRPRDKAAKTQIVAGEHSTHIDIQATGSKPGHVRFGSEDPEPVELANPENTQADTQDDEENESDDDAPEDMTAADAQATSTAAQKQAARAVEQQQAKARKKRQEREKRLQEQAKVSSKTKRQKPVDLPDLLPEDVLADEATTRPPTPPREEPQIKSTSAASNNGKIKFQDSRPKDIRVGPVTVSVLEKQNKLLPPKANGRAKSLKDQWLAGRRGSGITRQSVGGGFVRG